MPHIAHIRVDKSGEEWTQSVAAHCRQVAAYAAESLSCVSLFHIGYLAGLLHDIGKAKQQYTEYIYKASHGELVRRGAVNHTFAACIFVLERYHTAARDSYDRLTAELLAWVCGSHHGMFDCWDTDGKNGFAHRTEYDREQIAYDESIAHFLAEVADGQELDELFRQASAEVKALVLQIKREAPAMTSGGKAEYGKSVQFLLGQAARLVLSAVIDGDRRDTAEFMSGQKRNPPAADQALWAREIARVESRLGKFQADTPINQARAYISDTAKDFAGKSGGIIRLTVPTGAGKTLTTLRYALHHAAAQQKKRIFFIIPLLSVLDQNTAVIKDWLDPALVSLHSSNVVTTDLMPEELDRYELAAETFDTPVMITTLVQLLDALFSGKTTAIRRMKSFCNSVIVIDEVQTVPKKLLYLFNLAVDFLAFFCGTTLVLTSATQPVLDEMDYRIALSPDNEMVRYDKERFSVFRRTEVIDRTSPAGMTEEEIAAFAQERIAETSSLLLICNTKTAARKIFQLLRNASGEAYETYHLSTAMCMAHRLENLERINSGLAASRTDPSKKLICVATQLVEAGVDFSFETCIRLKAGLDSVAQAAGRCNRNGEYAQLCKVYIVNLRGENLTRLTEIKTAQNALNQFLENYHNDSKRYGADLLSPESITSFYRTLTNQITGKNHYQYIDGDYSLFDYLTNNTAFSRVKDTGTKYYFNQSFKLAGERFKVYEEDTADAIVPYNDAAKNLITDLLSQRAKYDMAYLHDKLEEAKPYSVKLYRYQLDSAAVYADENNRMRFVSEQFYDGEIGFNLSKDLFY
ncbi:MAG: CRISPR-associated helicase Cas3' [Oscillospiraceae bacterium]